MPRYCTTALMALAAWGLIWIAPVRADDTADMHAEISKLKTELESLSRQDAAELDTAIETYLAETDSWKGAQGEDKWQAITMGAAVTAVNQNTLALDPGNKSVVSGRVDLWFNFNVAEGLDIHVELLGATGGTFPAQFPLDQGGFGPPATLAGAFDGIGVNSTVSTRPLGGVQVREAFIRYAYAAGNTTLNWELGMVDPRDRFLQNAFMSNQYTGFMHNQFKDASAISWATNGFSSAPSAPGASPTILGLYGWVSFGENDAFTVSYGWFNTPGEFFDSGQLYVQFGWKGQVRGREMNVQILWVYDNAYNKGFANGEDADNQWGASWDWMASDRIGLFFRIAGNSENTNFVEASAAFGLVYSDIGARKDEAGLAIGYAKGNSDSAIGFLPEDTEWTLELYYKFMLADGKFQITPNLIYVADPGGGGLAWEDDSLFIIGVRFYVPF